MQCSAKASQKNYAWCEIIGPEGFFKGSDFLLGPHRHYKDHFHLAPELCWLPTALSDWKKGDGAFIPRSSGRNHLAPLNDHPRHNHA
jgi:hypothetical protein